MIDVSKKFKKLKRTFFHDLKFFFIFFILFKYVFGFFSYANGTDMSDSLVISATVLKNCHIDVLPLYFGYYDSIVSNAKTDLLARSKIVLACTKNTEATILVDNGINGNKSMTNGHDFLKYALYYQNYARPFEQIPYFSKTKAQVSIPILGKIFSGQNVSPGLYTDTVSVTVNFY